MDSFRYETHIERHRALLRERDYDRLVNVATGKQGRRMRLIARARILLNWTQVHIRRGAVNPMLQPKLNTQTRPIAD